MSVKFCSIASGSDGNCIFVGTDDTKILIDSGLSGIRIQKGLLNIGIDPSKIDAIFITHEHSDHILGAGVLSRRFNIPVYATEDTWESMSSSVGKIEDSNKKLVFEEEICFLNDMKIYPFEIPHDAVRPVGYNIFAKGHKISIATDIGHVTDTLKDNLYDSDLILIESNHDIDMLKSGPYPYYLKKRIMGDYGHLSNVDCGQLLSDIITTKLKYILLGHLSGENNIPSLAYNTVRNILENNKIKIDTDATSLRLSVATRRVVSEPLLIS